MSVWTSVPCPGECAVPGEMRLQEPRGAGWHAIHQARGGPRKNGYAESFHGRLSDDFLAAEIFWGIRGARTLTASGRDEYNTQRPHKSLPWSALFLNPLIPLVQEIHSGHGHPSPLSALPLP
jgi:hypothetical protein